MRSAFEMLLLRMMVFSPSLVDQNLMPSQAESDDVEQHSDQLRDEQSETPVDRPLRMLSDSPEWLGVDWSVGR